MRDFKEIKCRKTCGACTSVPCANKPGSGVPGAENASCATYKVFCSSKSKDFGDRVRQNCHVTCGTCDYRDGGSGTNTTANGIIINITGGITCTCQDAYGDKVGAQVTSFDTPGVRTYLANGKDLGSCAAASMTNTLGGGRCTACDGCTGFGGNTGVCASNGASNTCMVTAGDRTGVKGGITCTCQPRDDTRAEAVSWYLATGTDLSSCAATPMANTVGVAGVPATPTVFSAGTCTSCDGCYGAGNCVGIDGTTGKCNIWGCGNSDWCTFLVGDGTEATGVNWQHRGLRSSDCTCL